MRLLHAGMLVTARDIVTRVPEADDARIRLELSGNLCRCTGYVGIVRAVESSLEGTPRGRVQLGTFAKFAARSGRRARAASALDPASSRNAVPAAANPEVPAQGVSALPGGHRTSSCGHVGGLLPSRGGVEIFRRHRTGCSLPSRREPDAAARQRPSTASSPPSLDRSPLRLSARLASSAMTKSGAAWFWAPAMTAQRIARGERDRMCPASGERGDSRGPRDPGAARRSARPIRPQWDRRRSCHPRRASLRPISRFASWDLFRNSKRRRRTRCRRDRFCVRCWWRV